MTDGSAGSPDPSTLTLQPGDIVAGAYRVERLLGQGAMGLVVAACPLVGGGPRVALKLLQADHLERGEALARFEREVRLLRQLRSPHVAAVLDAGFHDQHIPFMAIELLDGHDLDAELQARGPLPLVEVADLALQALDALVEAHALGIVHRDLKPANIFLARTPGGRTLKVIDFGISKQDGDDPVAVSLTKTHSLIGSPLYMAPEQVLAARAVDARADVWSLGVVLFELLAGLTPFDGPSVGVVLGNVMSAPIPSILDRRPDLPVAFGAVLGGCFERAPARRLSSLALARALAPFASATGVAALARIERLSAGLLPTPEPSSLNSLQTSPDARALAATSSASSAPGASPLASTQVGGPSPQEDPVTGHPDDVVASSRGPVVALLLVLLIVAVIVLAAWLSPA